MAKNKKKVVCFVMALLSVLITLNVVVFANTRVSEQTTSGATTTTVGTTKAETTQEPTTKESTTKPETTKKTTTNKASTTQRQTTTKAATTQAPTKASKPKETPQNTVNSIEGYCLCTNEYQYINWYSSSEEALLDAGEDEIVLLLSVQYTDDNDFLSSVQKTLDEYK